MSTTVEHMFSQGWLLLDRVEELPGNQVGTGLNPSTMNDAEQATQSWSFSDNVDIVSKLCGVDRVVL